MEFRWVALIALWTILSGPVFGPPTNATSSAKERAPSKTTVNKSIAPRH